MSIELFVLCEGKTEVEFIRHVIKPELARYKINCYGKSAPTSRTASGGALTWDRCQDYLKDVITENDARFVTTLIDLYGLHKTMPGYDQAQKIPDVYKRLEFLEKAFEHEVLEKAKCRKGHFIPHIQPYEFEALLFSDIEKITGKDFGWSTSRVKLQLDEIMRECEGHPELINNSWETRPSKRLKSVLQGYDKVIHGFIIAKSITLPTIESKCPHFQAWMNRLRALSKQEPQ